MTSSGVKPDPTAAQIHGSSESPVQSTQNSSHKLSSASCSSLSEKQPQITEAQSTETREFLPDTNADDEKKHTEQVSSCRSPGEHEQPSNACQLSRSRSANPETAPLHPRMSIDAEGNIYPEGGIEAYTVVLGSFFALFGSLGLVNSAGSFQAWISAHQLKDYNQSAISWIFGLYAFLMFFGSLQVGPVFDAKGPKMLVLAGTILIVLSISVLGSCEEYWHFMVVFAVIGGIGISLVFTPAVASPGHFFYRLRGRATGIAATGGSVGGVVFPLMLDALYPKIGFAWATRAVALVCLVTMVLGCILMKSRLPKKRATKENILPDLRILKHPVFGLTTVAIFLIEWGLFIPITFMTSYALDHGMPRALSFQLLALLNAGSFFGRWIPGYISDYIGRFNTMILTVLLCLVSNACIWLPAGNSAAMMIAYAVIFGFASGSNISMTPVCIGQTCKTEHYGRYYATAYTVVSFGTLTGTPIAGSILTRNGGDYWGLITFTSCCYFAGLICFIAAKILRVGWNPLTID